MTLVSGNIKFTQTRGGFLVRDVKPAQSDQTYVESRKKDQQLLYLTLKHTYIQTHFKNYFKNTIGDFSRHSVCANICITANINDTKYHR